MVKKHAVLLINRAKAQRCWHMRRYLDRTAPDKILHTQFGTAKINDSSVEKNKSPVVTKDIALTGALVFYHILLLLAASVLLVWPSESKAIALTMSLTLPAIEARRKRTIAADFALYT
jgi:hypothetical protein